MLLSQLVHYRTQLDRLSPKDTAEVVRDHAGPSLHWVESNDIQYSALTKKLRSSYEKINRAYNDYDEAVSKIQTQIQRDIDALEPRYFAESYRLYDEDFVNDSADYILARKFNLFPDIVEYLHARIKVHGDWRHAGMIIRPGNESWIEHLVACDPLYLIDQSTELLIPAMNRFNEQYQNRLRSYSVRESTVDPMLDRIPNGQFGYCLVYNFFNYKPFDLLKCYLTEIFEKLHAGGTLAFTFNNCDRRGGVELVERSFMCYTPGNLVTALCENIGFEIVEQCQLDDACAWIELRKPGVFQTLRGGQSLARVVAKSK